MLDDERYKCKSLTPVYITNQPIQTDNVYHSFDVLNSNINNPYPPNKNKRNLAKHIDCRLKHKPALRTSPHEKPTHLSRDTTMLAADMHQCITPTYHQYLDLLSK